MGVNLLTPPPLLDHGRRHFGFFDDFLYQVDADLWTEATSVDGTATVQAQVGGVIDLVTAVATAGNEAIVLATTNETFLLADGKPLIGEMRYDYQEANTDTCNVLFGFLDAIAATSIQDNGAGPDATYDGACFFKVDSVGGANNWQVESSDGSTQTTHELTSDNSLDSLAHGAPTAAAGTFSTLRIEIVPTSSTRMDVAFFIDGTLVKKHDQTYTTPTEMDFGVVIKDGASANEETFSIDYLSAWQLR